MKKYFSFLVFIFLLACNGDNFNNSNPYLSNVNFSIDINTNLPDYNALQFPGNPKLIHGAGVQGIIVMKNGAGNSYVAWEASCPNQYPTTCSKLIISGSNAKCSCDSFLYSIFTGQGGQQYPLKAYRVEANGNIIRVYN
jgi:nitrite reductase/ring-hydroxylating ferredoxin subunit